jgi:fermentation-respiration switch protein FrsA (DUF1100 family)
VPKDKQVFLLLTHLLHSDIEREFKRIREGGRDFGDVLFLFHLQGDAPARLREYDHYSFTDSDMADLGYDLPQKSLLPGRNHYPLLDFYRNNRDYDYYWVIEYDVRFTGAWGSFFNTFSSFDHGFISSVISPYHEQPEWVWWSTLTHPQQKIPLQACWRAFNPIYRISGAALDYIDRALSNGWQGHHEVLLPTLLHHKGFKLLDFGGAGSFVAHGMENRYYLSENNRDGTLCGGTMQFRPIFRREGSLWEKLYHPVKPWPGQEDSGGGALGTSPG